MTINVVALKNPADGLRAVLALAVSGDWSHANAAALAIDPPTVAEAVDRLAAKLDPLEAIEPEAAGPKSDALRDALRMIGMKIAPTMSVEQAENWLTALVIALNDLPADIATQAAREAHRTPINFPNEVDGIIRERATVLIARRQYALKRLKRFQDEITRPAKPMLTDAHPDRNEVEWTVEDLRKAGMHMAKLGLAGGWITQAQIDEAFPEPDPTPPQEEI